MPIRRDSRGRFAGGGSGGASSRSAARSAKARAGGSKERVQEFSRSARQSTKWASRTKEGGTATAGFGAAAHARSAQRSLATAQSARREAASQQRLRRSALRRGSMRGGR